jgi:hypothetical protein
MNYNYSKRCLFTMFAVVFSSSTLFHYTSRRIESNVMETDDTSLVEEFGNTSLNDDVILSSGYRRFGEARMIVRVKEASC